MAMPGVAALQRLAQAPAVGPEAAESFLSEHCPAVFSELPAVTSAAELEQACSGLKRVLATQPGADFLPQLVPFAVSALQADDAPPQLRRLSAQQLARAAQAGALPPEALPALFHALEAADVGVADDAGAALAGLGPTQPGPALAALQALLASPDPVLRARALTLAMGAAARSPGSADAVLRSGLLEPLLAELRGPGDVLSGMAALALVQSAAEAADGAVAAALAGAVQPALQALVAGQEPLLRCSALRASATLLGAALEGGRPESGARLVLAPEHPLLDSLKAALDPAGTAGVPLEVEEAAMEAVGLLGAHRAGAAALAEHPSRLLADVAARALGGRTPHPSLRMAALHSLAALAGAERAAEGGTRSAALLPGLGEAALRAAVYQGAADTAPPATPPEAFVTLLGHPFLEVRVAAYRALAALLLRDWFAAEAAGHAPLLGHLLSPKAETSRQGAEWRHACVLALARTASDLGAAGLEGGAGAAAEPHPLAVAAPLISAAARQGPYGAGLSEPEGLLSVATQGQ